MISSTGHQITIHRGKVHRFTWPYFGLAIFFFAFSQHTRGMTAAESIRGYYHHTAWGLKEGAPQGGIWAITQTHDGWLWLAGQFGLVRFDGVKFESIETRSASSTDPRGIGAMYTSRAGDLWISYQFRGAAQLRQGMPDAVESFSDLPAVVSFSEDGDGRMWGVTHHDFWVLDGPQWRRVDTEWGLPSGASIADLTLDPEETLWIGTDKGFYSLRKGSRRFDRSEEVPTGFTTLGLSHSGQLWRHDRTGYALIKHSYANRDQPHSSYPQLEGNAEILARDGSWWSVECPKGICRAHPDNSAEPHAPPMIGDDFFAAQDGLTSDRAMEIYEDREGNIWVGTKLGLDQFRRNAFISVQFPEPLIHFSMVADPKSGIWTGTDMSYANLRDTFWRLDPNPTRFDDISEPTNAALAEVDGSAIVGGHAKLWRLVDGHAEPLPVPPEIKGRILCVFRADTGSLWVGVQSLGLFEVIGTQWVPRNNALGDKVPHIAVRAVDGSEWLGFQDNRIVVMKNGQFRTLSKAEGLGVGDVVTILAGSPTLVGGELGLQAFDGSHFVALHTERPDDLKSIAGLVRTSDGTTWLFNSRGALQISAEELRRGASDSNYRMRVRSYDADDGLPGGSQSATTATNLIADKQGRLWFAASNGLAWLNPESIPRNDIAPTVEVQSVVTPVKAYSASGRPTLPAGTRNIDITFTALSLAVPSRVSFKAQLLGIDSNWRDFGNVRKASYSNLGPGTYRFQVKASNNDGVWSETPAAVDFAIAPLFYQTRWFYTLCGAATLFLLWQLYLLRVQLLARQMRVRMGERLEERERIARELHDTLLQSTQGLILLFQGFAGRLDRPDPMRSQMEAALDQADHLLNEARDRVSDLRTTGIDSDIPRVLNGFAQELLTGKPIGFKTVTIGTPVVLDAAVADDIYRIGREALTNAATHAQAANIELEIGYEAERFRLRIRDDGKGIDQELQRSGGRPHHFGLQGMRERAQRIGGTLDIWSRDTAGTEVELSVPAARAYDGYRSKRGWISAVLAWARSRP